MATIRQKIAVLLSQSAMDARDLSAALSISEKEVYHHLPHVARSLVSENKRLVILDFTCRSCHFTFKNRNRYTRPGKCPRCRNTYIEYPLYMVKE